MSNSPKDNSNLVGETPSDAIIKALRSSPSHLIIGEVRDPEALRLWMEAGNTADRVPHRRQRVVVESPYRGKSYEDLEVNLTYARQAMRDALLRNEAPFLSHLLYTQEGVLDDTIPEERQFGIDAGLEWSEASDYSVVYIDRGISTGMNYGIAKAINNGKQVHFRSLYGEVISIETLLSSGLTEDTLRLLTERKGLLQGVAM